MTNGKIDFFIVGAQKGGTTALDAYLRGHRSIQMAAQKEAHFFDEESIDWSQPDYEILHSHFDWRDGAIAMRGEATPIYCYWPDSAERLSRYNPGAKLILCLRHPAYRAHSHWRMEIKRGAETLSFEEAVGETGRKRVLDAVHGVHRVFSYVERGFYARQIRRLQRIFPPRQLLYLRTEDLWLQPQHTIDLVLDFLGVPGELKVEQAYKVPVHTGDADAISSDMVRALNSLYAYDLAETAQLTGLSLEAWTHPDYREPMAPK
jgi:Sulfotransferase domain